MNIRPTPAGGRRVEIDTAYLRAVIEDGKVLEWTQREPGPRFTVPPNYDPAKQKHGCCDPPADV